ncbi:ABC transporter ATP-binding protein [Actinomadura gamaensis]|uniref:ABC transporter ATP-binding protein n=1 Tax=Actinomadura gamaensis TaxID=1763541 RepID=A0ABV9TWI4_9ACTN
MEIVRLTAVSKTFGTGAGAVTALDKVTLGFAEGSFTAVMGASGSGKSTLLQCAAGLERPTAGAVSLAGADLSRLRESALTRLRRETIGFVFQSYNLLPALTAEQNVGLPLRLAGHRPHARAVAAALDAVGLGDRARHRPAELSGGQQQRVAIARALVTAPRVLFADEPTGALDSTASRAVLGILRSLVDDRGQTIVMVTHDPIAAAHADRVVFLADGRLAGTLDHPDAATVAAHLTALEAGDTETVGDHGTSRAGGAMEARTTSSATLTADGTTRAADGMTRAADGTTRAADGMTRTVGDTTRTADDATRAVGAAARTADDATRAVGAAARTADDATRAVGAAARTADDATRAVDGGTRAAGEAGSARRGEAARVGGRREGAADGRVGGAGWGGFGLAGKASAC